MAPFRERERDAKRWDTTAELEPFGIKKSRDGGDGKRNGGDDKRDGGDGGGGGGGGGGNGNNNGGKNNSDNSDNKDNNNDSNNDGGGGGGGSKDNSGNKKNDNNTNDTSSKPTDSPTVVFVPPPPPTTSSTPPILALPPLAITTSLLSLTSTPIPTTSSVSIPQSTSVVTSVTIALTTTTAFIPVMTTSPIESVSTQPRKGVDNTALPDLASTTSLSTIPFTATDTAASATGTSDANDDDDDNGHHDKKNKDKGSNGQLDPTAERALIAAGSIGAFILFCFIGWIVYRTIKKSKMRKEGGYSGGFFDRLPWRRGSNDAGWDNRSMFMTNELPPVYEKGDANSMQNGGFYGAEKRYPPQPGNLVRSNTIGSQRSILSQPLAPGSVVVIPAEDYAAMSQAAGGDGSSTLRSLMPDPFFNQSELARQPSDAYNPAQRQVNRASEISSLSSGFGDFDIIIPDTISQPQPAAAPLRQSQLRQSQVQQTNNFMTRFSWMSRRDNGQRETVYTATSEDRPARFRSVNSWVNQQTGRLKRADERKQADEDIPAVPDLPAS